MKKSFARIAMGLALCGALPAQAATPPCLNPEEMHGLIGYFLPEVIGQATEKCSAFLPAESYLRTQLPRLGETLARHKAEAWPTAKAAFLKMGDPKDSKDMRGLPDSALRPLVDAAMATKLAIPFTQATCGEVNDITEALAPLTPDQTVHLFATIFNAAARNDNKLRSCPRESH